MHTYTQHTHACICTYTQQDTHTCIHTCMHTYMHCIHTHASIHIYTYTHIHTCIQIYACTHTLTDMHTYIPTALGSIQTQSKPPPGPWTYLYKYGSVSFKASGLDGAHICPLLTALRRSGPVNFSFVSFLWLRLFLVSFFTQLQFCPAIRCWLIGSFLTFRSEKKKTTRFQEQTKKCFRQIWHRLGSCGMVQEVVGLRLYRNLWESAGCYEIPQACTAHAQTVGFSGVAGCCGWDSAIPQICGLRPSSIPHFGCVASCVWNSFSSHKRTQRVRQKHGNKLWMFLTGGITDSQKAGLNTMQDSPLWQATATQGELVASCFSGSKFSRELNAARNFDKRLCMASHIGHVGPAGLLSQSNVSGIWRTFVRSMPF